MYHAYAYFSGVRSKLAERHGASAIRRSRRTCRQYRRHGGACPGEPGRQAPTQHQPADAAGKPLAVDVGPYAATTAVTTQPSSAKLGQACRCLNLSRRIG